MDPLQADACGATCPSIPPASLVANKTVYELASFQESSLQNVKAAKIFLFRTCTMIYCTCMSFYMQVLISYCTKHVVEKLTCSSSTVT